MSQQEASTLNSPHSPPYYQAILLLPSMYGTLPGTYTPTNTTRALVPVRSTNKAGAQRIAKILEAKARFGGDGGLNDSVVDAGMLGGVVPDLQSDDGPTVAVGEYILLINAPVMRQCRWRDGRPIVSHSFSLILICTRRILI